MSQLVIRYLLLFLFAFILQMTLVNFIEILQWRPDLLLIVLVAFALRKGPDWGMTAGFLIGLLQDMVGTELIGLAALSKTVAGFLAGVLSGKFAERAQFLLTLLISGLAHDFIYFFIYTLGEHFSLQSLIIFYTIPNLMYTIIIGGLLYYFMEPLMAE
ncbi:MAG: rod shape-determining protein MreD [Calditrichaeota bacterium]|nr:rod shape-determining protein MreD [Calditrichota bacterium]RQW07673.1 MAG: rod shape-determining protein MreD [Calditrichota bacterium]